MKPHTDAADSTLELVLRLYNEAYQALVEAEAAGE